MPEEHAVRLDAAERLDAVVHHHVPILARQDLQVVVRALVLLSNTV